jgi:hypothetical protein
VAARPLVLYGGIGVALDSIAHQVVSAINSHNLITGHDFSNHAVDQALTKGAANLAIAVLYSVAGLALAAGMIAVVLNSMRVGLLTRWLGILGIVSGVLFFVRIGGATLEVIPAFWLVAMGILYSGRWPNGTPPAWASGEARPWPSQAELRASRQAGKGQPALSAAAADVAPAPAQPASERASRKRRRKRGARR